MTEPATATAPDALYRVGRSRSLLNYSTISPLDASLPKAGNRFDVIGGGVLYCGTTLEACYAETLARFRPTPRIRKLLAEEKGFMIAGGVPRDWRLQRSIAKLRLGSPLPFLDVDDPATHEHLSEVLAAELVGLGYDSPLDISDVCNRDRRLSRTIALYAFTATEPDGSPSYSGIRYTSRIRSTWECWAIFDGTEVISTEEHAIELSDPALKAVADLWGLRIF